MITVSGFLIAACLVCGVVAMMTGVFAQDK